MSADQIVEYKGKESFPEIEEGLSGSISFNRPPNMTLTETELPDSQTTPDLSETTRPLGNLPEEIPSGHEQEAPSPLAAQTRLDTPYDLVEERIKKRVA